MSDEERAMLSMFHEMWSRTADGEETPTEAEMIEMYERKLRGPETEA